MSAIDYDLTKIRAIAFDVDGVLSPSTIPLSADGEPLRMVNIKDGYAIQLAVKCGLRLAIISGGNTRAIRIRFESLGMRDIYLGAAHKLDIFNMWMKEYGLEPEQVAFVGDDIPDLKVLRAAGLSCCPYDACAEVRQTCRYVSKYTGGYGVGRDILEQILKAQGHWLAEDKAFGW